MNTKTKIVKLPTLKKKIAQLKRAGNKIAFTNGCFDILHAGHVSYLEQAKKGSRILIVGLNSDRSVKKIKGSSRPIVGEGQRAAILAAMACVDYVVLFHEATPLKLIEAVKPDILIKGADWKKKALLEAKASKLMAAELSIYSLCVDFLRLISLSVLKKMQKRNDKKFNRIIDANFNRAKEGLRVCEDVCRFILDKKGPTQNYKAVRHQLTEAISSLKILSMIRSRDIGRDVGRKSTAVEFKRSGAMDIFYANSQRVKESIRVLEEFTKLRNKQLAEDIKKLRYKVYALEKKVIERR